MKNKIVSILATMVVFAVFTPQLVSAHCDTMDGPVVTAAKKALETKNVDYVLVWVKKEKEPEVKEALQKTLSSLVAHPGDKEAAEMSFFESLVRIHREGEGEPFTRIKPVGTIVDPVIVLADKAISQNSIDPLSKAITEELSKNIQNRFEGLQKMSHYKVNEVEKGREYIETYVSFMHFVEEADALAKTQVTKHQDTESVDVHVDETEVTSLKRQLYFSWAGIVILLMILLFGYAKKIVRRKEMK